MGDTITKIINILNLNKDSAVLMYIVALSCLIIGIFNIEPVLFLMRRNKPIKAKTYWPERALCIVIGILTVIAALTQ